MVLCRITNIWGVWRHLKSLDLDVPLSKISTSLNSSFMLHGGGEEFCSSPPNWNLGFVTVKVSSGPLNNSQDHRFRFQATPLPGWCPSFCCLPYTAGNEMLGDKCSHRPMGTNNISWPHPSSWMAYTWLSVPNTCTCIVKNVLVLRWSQRAHCWFWGRPKRHVRSPKGHGAPLEKA